MSKRKFDDEDEQDQDYQDDEISDDDSSEGDETSEVEISAAPHQEAAETPKVRNTSRRLSPSDLFKYLILFHFQVN